jgi:thiamine biosynthesis lipoprotein
MKQHLKNPPRIGRRNFLQIIAAAGVTGALWQFGIRPKNFTTHTARQSRIMMGTQINLIVHGPDLDRCENAIESTFARMDELVGKLSRHNPESELSALNNQGILSHPSEDLRQVLLLADHISSVTEGAFDITILPLLKLYSQAKKENILPFEKQVATSLDLVDYRKVNISDTSIILTKKGMAITLDGIGKGYIVDQGTATLQSQGFTNVYVEAGGDLMVAGTKAENIPWRIGIRNPRPQKTSDLIAIEISNKAVATSGDYMQPFTTDMKHHHIIDPRSGISPPELASATVCAPTVALADGLATAAMVMGPEQALVTLESLPDCEGFFIGKDLQQYRTKGFLG